MSEIEISVIGNYEVDSGIVMVTYNGRRKSTPLGGSFFFWGHGPVEESAVGPRGPYIRGQRRTHHCFHKTLERVLKCAVVDDPPLTRMPVATGQEEAPDQDRPGAKGPFPQGQIRLPAGPTKHEAAGNSWALRATIVVIGPWRSQGWSN
jgi:hypothetical protein